MASPSSKDAAAPARLEKEKEEKLTTSTSTASITTASAGPRVWVVVFDLDGTLVESVDTICLAINKTLRKFKSNCNLITVDDVRDMIGDGATVLLNKAFMKSYNCSEKDIPVDAMDYFLEVYEELGAHKSYLYEDVLETLTRLADQKDVLLSIATNKPQKVADRVVDELGLRKYFGLNVVGGDVMSDKKKPHRHHLDVACTMAINDSIFSKISAFDAIMIGDSHVDIYCAKNAGAFSIGCTWGYAKSDKPIQSCGADVIVESFSDVYDAVMDIKKKR